MDDDGGSVDYDSGNMLYLLFLLMFAWFMWTGFRNVRRK